MGKERIPLHARCNGRQEFDHGKAGFAPHAFAGPKDADIDGHRHARLAQLLVKHTGAHLVGRLDPRCHAGALGIDNQLARIGAARLDICNHLGDGGPPLAAFDRYAFQTLGIKSDDRSPQDVPFHDELGRWQGSENHHDIEEGLMLGRNQHLARGHLSPDLGLDPNHPSHGPEHIVAVGLATGPRTIFGQQGIGQIGQPID
mmetsp:Transcript_23619/g.41877  ORF Transcript_23619/g.41877 Transcript_23619/m.41877 type:complete len:201 (-) Transcript_23619:128-730(-)